MMRWLENPLFPFMVFWLLVNCSPSPPTTDEIRREAACAAIHEFYDQGQTTLIERGLCDDAPDVEHCAAHQLFVDTKILALTKAKCETKAEP